MNIAKKKKVLTKNGEAKTYFDYLFYDLVPMECGSRANEEVYEWTRQSKVEKG